MSKSVFLSRSTSEAGDHLDSIASEKKLSTAGPLRSAYTPKLALSLTVRTPNFTKSPMELSDPPLVVGGGSSAMLMAVAIVSCMQQDVGGSSSKTEFEILKQSTGCGIPDTRSHSFCCVHTWWDSF